MYAGGDDGYYRSQTCRRSPAGKPAGTGDADEQFAGDAYRFRNDADRSMEFVSEGCYQLSGYSPEEFIGTRQISVSELTHPDDRDILWNAIQIALAENRPYQLNYRITCKNGELKWVWEQGLGVYSDSGELIALEGLITDVSEQKRSEEAFAAVANRVNSTKTSARTYFARIAANSSGIDSH